MTTFNPTVSECDDYLASRTGSYEYRSVRYEAAAAELTAMGLSDTDTVVDIGAGMTEFDYHLRTTRHFKGRYIPIDGGIDGTDLNYWKPQRQYDYAVALEILEHLDDPESFIRRLQRRVTRGIVVSVPNPRTVDVLGIDPTHVTVVPFGMLSRSGFMVVEKTFYGGVFSNGEPDSLFAVWDRS